MHDADTPIDAPVEVQIRKAFTLRDVVNDHIAGLSGYQIADKYGVETELIKRLINEADQRLMFVPEGVEPPVDALGEAIVEPLAEGEEPSAKSPRGHA